MIFFLPFLHPFGLVGLGYDAITWNFYTFFLFRVAISLRFLLLGHKTTTVNKKGKRENEWIQRDCFQFSQYIFASLIHPHFINCFVFSIYRIYLQFQMNAKRKKRTIQRWRRTRWKQQRQQLRLVLRLKTEGDEGERKREWMNCWNKYSQTNKPIVCSQLWMCFVWHIRKLASGIPSEAATTKYLCVFSLCFQYLIKIVSAIRHNNIHTQFTSHCEYS